MLRKRYEPETVALDDLVSEEILDGFTFRACPVIGPGVVYLGQSGELMLGGNKFDFSPNGIDAMLYEVAGPDESPITHRFVNSSFLMCEFVNVGFAGSAERLAEFRDSIMRPTS